MSPKLGQSKTDSVDEDRNYVVVQVDLCTGDVDEVIQFAELGDANACARGRNAADGHGPYTVHAVMHAETFDALED
jgi:hypothetical protein